MNAPPNTDMRQPGVQSGPGDSPVLLPVFPGGKLNNLPIFQTVSLPVEASFCDGMRLSDLRKPALPDWLGPAQLLLEASEWNLVYQSPRSEYGGPAVTCHLSCRNGEATAVLHVRQPSFEGGATCALSPESRLSIRFDPAVEDLPVGSRTDSAWEGTECSPPWMCPTWSLTDTDAFWVETAHL